MNERIQELADQILPNEKEFHQGDPRKWGYFFSGEELEKFAGLIKQAIYDKVKEELIEDEEINSEPAYFREYLKGCNSGIVDALCIIKNFGVEE